MALILECCQCRAACSGGTFAAWLERAQKPARSARPKPAPCRGERSVAHLWRNRCQICGGNGSKPQGFRALESAVKGRWFSMWCARLPLPRPGDTVVVCVGRNWAALGSPFFFLNYAAALCGEDASSNHAASNEWPFFCAAVASSSA